MLTRYIALLGAVEDDIVECFRHGGGVPCERFPRFHAETRGDHPGRQGEMAFQPDGRTSRSETDADDRDPSSPIVEDPPPCSAIDAGRILVCTQTIASTTTRRSQIRAHILQLYSAMREHLARSIGLIITSDPALADYFVSELRALDWIAVSVDRCEIALE